MARFKSLLAVCAALLLAAGAASAGTGQGSGHGEHGNLAEGVGTLNTIDTANRKVNISHGPMPAIGWTEMTMDFPVLESVDLTAFEAGQKIQFVIEMLPDNTYPIHAMCETDKDEIVPGLCGTHDDHDAHDH